VRRGRELPGLPGTFSRAFKPEPIRLWEVNDPREPWTAE
jgi:hypothetical protein